MFTSTRPHRCLAVIVQLRDPRGSRRSGECVATAGVRKVCSVQISHTHFWVEFPLFLWAKAKEDRLPWMLAPGAIGAA